MSILAAIQSMAFLRAKAPKSAPGADAERDAPTVSAAARDKRARKAAKFRRDQLHAARGRAEPGHPGCTCTGPHTSTEFNRKGHASGCPAYATQFSREDELEALYGAR